MNFLSACGCYPGFLLGAKLGELENIHPWICALAGGMFVYVGLTDMVYHKIYFYIDFIEFLFSR
jgi:hypothetical protein